MGNIASKAKSLATSLVSIFFCAALAMSLAPTLAFAENDVNAAGAGNRPGSQTVARLYSNGDLVFSNAASEARDERLIDEWTGFTMIDGSSDYYANDEREYGYIRYAPWSRESSLIKRVVFECEIVPISTYGWFSGCINLTEVVGLDKISGEGLRNVAWMFANCWNLEKIDLTGFDISYVSDMSHMFEGCIALKTADFSALDTSSVTDMSWLLESCRSLTSANLSGLDTLNVTNMARMFSWCESLESIDVSGFDTAQVNDMFAMFYACESLKELDVSGFDTGNVTSMGWMFRRCPSLKSLDLTSFDTSQVVDMAEMFRDSSALFSVNLSSFDTSQVRDMFGMFSGCSSLAVLDLSSFDTRSVEYTLGRTGASSEHAAGGQGYMHPHNYSKATGANYGGMKSMFYGCDALSSIRVGSAWSPNDVFGGFNLPPSNTKQTGLWVKQGSSTGYTPGQLVRAFKPSMAGTYVWQKRTGSMPEFSDVNYKKPDWFASSVTQVASMGLMTGIGSTKKFGTASTLTRAQLAVILWRIDRPSDAARYKASGTKNKTGMSDVKAGQWYTGAANWAVSARVINGKVGKNGKKYFDPNGRVTFEQLVTVLANYIDRDGAVTANATYLDDFADVGSVSNWAKQSVAWGESNGLFSGVERDGRCYIEPGVAIKRERAAAVLVNAMKQGLL